MANRISFSRNPALSTPRTRAGSERQDPEETIVSSNAESEESSSDVSPEKIHDIAVQALRNGGQQGMREGPRKETSFVNAPACTRRWVDTSLGTLKLIVPLSFAAGVMYMAAAEDMAWTTVGLASGATASFVYQAFSARFGREQFKDGLRIAFTQLSSQFGAALTIKFGLEQLANHADPTLSAAGFTNGTHWDARPENLSGNLTEAYYIDTERVWPGASAWMSLAIVGLPAALNLVGFLHQPGFATTTVDSALDRLRLDARGGPGKIRPRWSDTQDGLIRPAVKAGIGAAGVIVVAGLLAGGHRKLALRILANANQVQFAARMRDFMNMVMRGVSPGSPKSASWPDGGWARQQQIEIPAAVMQALDEACTDPATLGMDEGKKKQALGLLTVWYRNLFIGARASSMPIYTAASVFGLYIMRDFFSPPLGAVFASNVHEALSVAVPFSLGTALTEGVEEPGWANMVELWAGTAGLPFEIARGPKNPRQRMSENLQQLSFTALLPGHNIVRGFDPSRYRPSQVKEEGTVALSLDDRLELNSGIRAFQNLATMTVLTSAGVSTHPTTKMSLYVLGVMINGCTHFRGNVVAQLLESGREARLMYEDQQGTLGNGHLPRSRLTMPDREAAQRRREITPDEVIDVEEAGLASTSESSQSDAGLPPLPENSRDDG